MTAPACRMCTAPLSRTFVDLGVSPLANSFLTREQLSRAEIFYPLRVWVCESCLLVQLEQFEGPEALFSDYVYFSSYSQSWLRHAETYAAAMVNRFALHPGSEVVEIASNDGYLLQYFTARGIPVLGVEPAANVAKVALARGIPTKIAFFGTSTAESMRATGHDPDLMVANNVLAHVPDMLDFLAGFRILLKSTGVATFEFPHLLPTMLQGQFDQIYHEHLSYLSLSVVQNALRLVGLRVFDVERLPTHGGSLRVFTCQDEGPHPERQSVTAVLEAEREAGLPAVETYSHFSKRAASIKSDVLQFLTCALAEGKTVCGYGAAAKGTTFINYCGIGPELLPVVADRSPHKQNTWFPGRHIPIVAPQEMLSLRPDYILILAWNLRDEISKELAMVRDWGGQFVTAIPHLSIF